LKKVKRKKGKGKYSLKIIPLFFVLTKINFRQKEYSKK